MYWSESQLSPQSNTFGDGLRRLAAAFQRRQVNPLAYIPANVDSAAILHAKFFKLL
jgi:hypothetical protein